MGDKPVIIPRDDFSKKVVVTLFLTLIIFVVAVFYFYWHGKTIPDSLIYSVFGAASGEGIVLGLIKVWKIRKNGGE